jgi:hypothetical protein
LNAPAALEPGISKIFSRKISSSSVTKSYHNLKNLFNSIKNNLKANGLKALHVPVQESSSVGESHPHALTDPDVNLKPRASLTCHLRQLSPSPGKCQLSSHYLARASVGRKISGPGERKRLEHLAGTKGNFQAKN